MDYMYKYITLIQSSNFQLPTSNFQIFQKDSNFRIFQKDSNFQMPIFISFSPSPIEKK